MAKVTLNQLMEVLQGSVGDLVFRQRPDGTIVVSRAPRRNNRKASAKQQTHRERFKEATRYARWAARVHPIYAELAAGPGASSWKSAYNYALSDWFEAPVIHRVEQGEGCIRVEASDNITVTKVRVTVLDETGSVLETGDATPTGENCWEFPSHARGATVIAEAWDLPEHVTKVVTPSALSGTSPGDIVLAG